VAKKPPISFGDKGVSFGGAQQGSKPPPKPKPVTPEAPKPPMGQIPVSPSGAKIWGKTTGVKTPGKGVINLPATIKPKETPEPPAPKPTPAPVDASGAKQWEQVTGVKSTPNGKKGLKAKLDKAAPKGNTPANAAPAQAAGAAAGTPVANNSAPKAASNKGKGQKPASSVSTSSTENSVNSGGNNSNSGPKIPAKAKAPSFSRDKANAARHSKTLLNRALKAYPNQNMDTRGTAGANAGEMTPPGDESATQLGGSEYKTFKANYLKTHKKSGKGLSDDSIRALARYLKHKGKGHSLFGTTAPAAPAAPAAPEPDPNAPTG
jgi:hypothetical protein